MGKLVSLKEFYNQTKGDKRIDKERVKGDLNRLKSSPLTRKKKCLCVVVDVN